MYCWGCIFQQLACCTIEGLPYLLSHHLSYFTIKDFIHEYIPIDLMLRCQYLISYAVSTTLRSWLNFHCIIEIISKHNVLLMIKLWDYVCSWNILITVIIIHSAGTSSDFWFFWSTTSSLWWGWRCSVLFVFGLSRWQEGGNSLLPVRSWSGTVGVAPHILLATGSWARGRTCASGAAWSTTKWLSGSI